MAQENVGININVQSNGEKALGSLKQQLREATAEVQALSEKFGATSQQREHRSLKTKLATLKT